ncbi:MAG: hypothetical protein KAQ89_00300 [Planctomycetes bacterium]|nr:hypothetical protein [Planctomycetota bacterium]
MKAEVQTTKEYNVILDEIEMLELCEEITNVEAAGSDSSALYKLRACLEGAHIK